MNTRTTPNQFVAIVLWILVTTLAWTLVPVNSLHSIHTYTDIPPLVLTYAIYGVLLGALIGVGQYGVFRLQGIHAKGWISNTLAFPLGLIVSILIAVLAWRLRGENLFPLTQPSTISMSPYPTSVAFGADLIWVHSMVRTSTPFALSGRNHGRTVGARNLDGYWLRPIGRPAARHIGSATRHGRLPAQCAGMGPDAEWHWFPGWHHQCTHFVYVGQTRWAAIGTYNGKVILKSHRAAEPFVAADAATPRANWSVSVAGV